MSLAGVSLGMHRIHGDDHAGQVEAGQHAPDNGDLIALHGDGRIAPSTAPQPWSNAATRCGAVGPRVRAPRMVLPSMATTRRWSTTAVRIHSQAARISPSFAASSRA